ncbi:MULTISPECIES: LamG-like jellyroll fold domain-containing protein [unclassified Carboxylicivirga]|uniref:LamG-like jellyroll fold domain-containing protein n=1 Tax=Carboxylicivirga TaxID=1628153 RepID=UPI003D32E769
MKKSLLFIATLFVCAMSYAQPSKGYSFNNDWSSKLTLPGASLSTAYADLQSFTIEFWWLREIAGVNRKLIDFGWDRATNKGFTIQISNDNMLALAIGNSVAYTDAGTINDFNNPKWEHLAFVFDGLNKTIKLYVNGVLSVENDPSTNPAPDKFPGSFASNFQICHQGMKCKMADIRVWGAVLDESTIANNYQDYIPMSHPNIYDLLHNWKMNEEDADDVNNVLDSGSSKVHGTISGAGIKFFNNTPTSIFDNKNKKADLYYNNTTKTLLIKNESIGVGSIRIYSLTGTLIKEKTMAFNNYHTKVPFTASTPGIYIVEVISNGERAYKKILVE